MGGVFMEKRYAKAYTEVLEILKHLPEDELERIPKTEIQFYESNKDKNYKYEYDKTLTVDKQKISEEANTVIIAIYMNYFANEKQRGIIDEILKQNTIREEQAKEEKYSVDKIFDKKSSTKTINSEKMNNEHLPVEIDNKKENFIRRIINKIKGVFRKNYEV